MTTPELESRLHIIQHALGRDQYGMLPRHIREEYRNHYVVGPGCDKYEMCLAMVDDGLMTRCPGNDLSGGMDVFVVTEAGRKFMADNSPKKKKPTRSQQRYQRYLDVTDCVPMKFREFLKWDCKQ